MTPLRPTAYGSAYGLTQPAAQEALRVAAIVVVDRIREDGAGALVEVLPPDARELIDETLVEDFADTAFLVGWKFGQASRLLLASLAEQIAGSWILRSAELMVQPRDQTVSISDAFEAIGEINQCREDVLDKRFLHEYLCNVESYSLVDLVPAEVRSKRASLWAPWFPGQGDPAPRTTGDDEVLWTLHEPGLTVREELSAMSAESERNGADSAQVQPSHTWRGVKSEEDTGRRPLRFRSRRP